MIRSIVFAALVGMTAVAHAEQVLTHPRDLDIARADMTDTPMKLTLESKRHFTLQLPGFSHHFDKPRYKDGTYVQGRKFNERNWGIGAQFEDPMGEEWADWVRKVSFGIMKDSLDAFGLYAGATLQKRAYDSPYFSVEVGGGAFLFYRTLQFDGKHLLVPAVLPVVSALHKPSGAGANVVFVPQFETSKGTMPGVIYLQLTKQF